MAQKLILNDIGDGRINNILTALLKSYSVENIEDIPCNLKLDVLLNTLQLSIEEFDELISNYSPVLRTVKGHAFEVAFEAILKKNGYNPIEAGGDTGIDLIVNNHYLQLKTPNLNGTKGFNIQYKTHKTHGAKSEKEAIEYYHSIDSFADFLVGLVSYNPFQVIIIPKNDLPRHKLNSNYIISPFTLNCENHKCLNNFQQIDVEINTNDFSYIYPQKSELLPKSSNKIGITSELIINTILKKSNFRIWDMSIRGFAREVAMKRLLKESNIECFNPEKVRKERGNKSDIAVIKNNTYHFIQVKGVSINNCYFSKDIPIIGVETQLTRGRVNDHATQSRLYLKSDFNYLLIVIDPPITHKLYKDEMDNFRWLFFLIPTEKLVEHKIYTNRLNSLQKFSIEDLKEYEIDKQKLSLLFQ